MFPLGRILEAQSDISVILSKGSLSLTSLGSEETYLVNIAELKS
jgi:hypothetical protein